MGIFNLKMKCNGIFHQSVLVQRLVIVTCLFVMVGDVSCVVVIIVVGVNIHFMIYISFGMYMYIERFGLILSAFRERF